MQRSGIPKIWSLATRGHLHKQNSVPSFFVSISTSVPICPLWFTPTCVWGDHSPGPGNMASPSSVTEIVRCQIFGEFVELDVAWHCTGFTGLLLVTEAENICQNVINMGLVTITMRRRWHWQMNSCTVISNIYSLLGYVTYWCVNDLVNCRTVTDFPVSQDL